MPDVVEIAKKCRAKLVTEICKLDDFVHMAEVLLKNAGLESNEAPDIDDEMAAEPGAKRSARSDPVAADRNRAQATRADLSDRAPIADEEVLNLRAKANVPASDRPGPFRQAPA
jgi:hypothetical protein